jgi:hypothetical protein
MAAWHLLRAQQSKRWLELPLKQLAQNNILEITKFFHQIFLLKLGKSDNLALPLYKVLKKVAYRNS